MTVRREGPVIHLEGECPVEEAETLAGLLENEADWSVDLSKCRLAHTALVQVLLRFRPKLQGAPEIPFLRDLIAPALAAGAKP